MILMEFDVSIFTDFGAWLFATAKQVYESMNFNFGEYTLNGFVILLAIGIFCLVCYAVGRIME